MAQDARDYVAQLYERELGAGRGSSEDPGIQAWADQIASGAMSREAVAQAINQSREGVAYDIAQAYERELGAGRSTSGDPGMQEWINVVAGGGMTTQQAIDAINRSQEAARYDIMREYTGPLQRQGTYEEMAAKDPGIAQWEQALMSGQITEQQFANAVRQSQEYRALQAGPKTDTPKLDPNEKFLKDIQALKDTIANNQKLFDAQQAAFAEQQKSWEQMLQNTATNQAALTSGYNRQITPLQQSLLQTNATENATRGYFSPVVPTYSPAVPTPSPGLPAGTAAPQPTGQAAFVPSQPASNTQVAPAPGYFVPQTYLAPAPPQYRGINPFASVFGNPFTSPFESYYSIASRRPGYSPQFGYGQQGQSNAFGYQAYPAPYVQAAPTPAPAQTTGAAQPLPAATTPTT